MRGLSLVVASRGYSSLQCEGFSMRWLLLLRSTGSRCAGFSSCGSRALEHRLSSCGAQAQLPLLLRGVWDLPRPVLEPMCPALAGGFLTTAPPGKPTHGVSCGWGWGMPGSILLLYKKMQITYFHTQCFSHIIRLLAVGLSYSSKILPLIVNMGVQPLWTTNPLAPDWAWEWQLYNVAETYLPFTLHDSQFIRLYISVTCYVLRQGPQLWSSDYLACPYQTVLQDLFVDLYSVGLTDQDVFSGFPTPWERT